MAEDKKSNEFSHVHEHSRAAIRAWGEGWKSLIPEGFLEKGREGQKEALLAVRSLLDVAIDRLEGGSGPAPRTRKKAKVEVD